MTTLDRLLERYRPALLWTDDLSRLHRSRIGHALLLVQLERTDTVARDNRARLVDIRGEIPQLQQWLHDHDGAHGHAQRRAKIQRTRRPRPA